MTAPFELPDDNHDMDTEFASDLGFLPGRWPTSFVYDSRAMHLLRVERDEEREVKWVDYGYDGGRLRVFND